MDSLPINPVTKQDIDAFLARPPHALLIYGPAGSGKLKLAQDISAKLLKTNIEKVQTHPYYTMVEKPPDKQEIPVDSIRGVIKKLALKTATSPKDQVSRVIVIDDADIMSGEAQNALLKILEEPPDKTIFILTAVSSNAVLPTIASRSQKLAIRPVNLEDSINFFSKDFDNKSIESAWQLSGGTPALMKAILIDDASHPVKSAVDSAKKLLSAEKYDRVIILDKLSDDKIKFAEILDALSKIVAALDHSAINAGNQIQSNNLLKARKLIESSRKSLQSNTSTRLLAIKLALQLPR